MPLVSEPASGDLPASLSLDVLKRRLDIEGTEDDDKLTDYLLAAFGQAQAAAPHGCGRLLSPDPLTSGESPVTRVIDVSARGRALVPDASAITSVTIDSTAVTGYKTLVKDGYIVQISALDVNDTATSATVVGHFGFLELPANLADAIYVLAARYHYEEAAQYADQIAILEGTAVQSYFRQLPPRVKMVFASYAVPMAIVGLR